MAGTIDDVERRLSGSTAFDGDTLRMKDGTRVRVQGVDTPEVPHKPGDRPALPSADRATEFTQEFADDPDSEVSLTGRRDHYGREIGNAVNRRTGEQLDEQLVRENLAWPSSYAEEDYTPVVGAGTFARETGLDAPRQPGAQRGTIADVEQRLQGNFEAANQPYHTRNEFAKGVVAGVDDIQAMGHGLRAWFNGVTGDDADRADAMDDYQREVMSAADRGINVQSLEEIDDADDLFDWMASSLGRAAPSLVGAVGTGGTGAVVGGATKVGLKQYIKKRMGDRLAQSVGVQARDMLDNPIVQNAIKRRMKAGAYMGAGAFTAGIETGGVYAELLEDGIDAPMTSLIAGTASGALDVFAQGLAIKRVLGPGTSDATVDGVKVFLRSRGADILKEGVKQGLVEGSTEAAQAMIQAAAIAYENPDVDFFTADTASAAKNAFAVGALVGAVTTGGGKAIKAPIDLAGQKLRERGQATEPQGSEATQSSKSASEWVDQILKSSGEGTPPMAYPDLDTDQAADTTPAEPEATQPQSEPDVEAYTPSEMGSDVESGMAYPDLEKRLRAMRPKEEAAPAPPRQLSPKAVETLNKIDASTLEDTRQAATVIAAKVEGGLGLSGAEVALGRNYFGNAIPALREGGDFNNRLRTMLASAEYTPAGSSKALTGAEALITAISQDKVAELAAPAPAVQEDQVPSRLNEQVSQELETEGRAPTLGARAQKMDAIADGSEAELRFDGGVTVKYQGGPGGVFEGFDDPTDMTPEQFEELTDAVDSGAATVVEDEGFRTGAEVSLEQESERRAATALSGFFRAVMNGRKASMKDADGKRVDSPSALRLKKADGKTTRVTWQSIANLGASLNQLDGDAQLNSDAPHGRRLLDNLLKGLAALEDPTLMPVPFEGAVNQFLQELNSGNGTAVLGFKQSGGEMTMADLAESLQGKKKSPQQAMNGTEQQQVAWLSGGLADLTLSRYDDDGNLVWNGGNEFDPLYRLARDHNLVDDRGHVNTGEVSANIPDGDGFAGESQFRDMDKVATKDASGNPIPKPKQTASRAEKAAAERVGKIAKLAEELMAEYKHLVPSGVDAVVRPSLTAETKVVRDGNTWTIELPLPRMDAMKAFDPKTKRDWLKRQLVEALTAQRAREGLGKKQSVREEWRESRAAGNDQSYTDFEDIALALAEEAEVGVQASVPPVPPDAPRARPVPEGGKVPPVTRRLGRATADGVAKVLRAAYHYIQTRPNASQSLKKIGALFGPGGGFYQIKNQAQSAVFDQYRQITKDWDAARKEQASRDVAAGNKTEDADALRGFFHDLLVAIRDEANDPRVMRQISDYLPRLYSTDAITADFDGFVDVLMKAKNAQGKPAFKTKQDATQFARAIQYRDGQESVIFAEASGNAAYNQHALSRFFTENPEGLEQFLVMDLDQVVASYAKGYSRMLAEAKFLGTEIDGQYVRNGKLQQALQESVDNGMAREEADYIQGQVYDALMGRSGANMHPTMRKWTQRMMMYQNLRTLMFSTLSSFVDVTGIMARTGDLSQTMASFKEFADKASREELREMAQTLGIIGDEATQFLLDQMYADGMSSDGLSRTVNEKFFKLIGQHHWTEATRMMAVAAGRRFLIKHANNVSNPSSAKLLESIAPEGVDADTMASLVKVWESEGARFSGNFLTMEPQERAVAEALHRFVDSSVMNPNAGQRPTWASDPMFALIFHLKQFMYSFHHTVLAPAARRAVDIAKEDGAMAAAGYAASNLGLMLSLAAGGLVLRNVAQYQLWGEEPPEDRQMSATPEYMIELFDRSGGAGIGQLFVDGAKASERGQYSLLAPLGPTVNQFESFVRASDDSDLLGQGKSNELIKAVPGLSQIYPLRAGLINYLED